MGVLKLGREKSNSGAKLICPVRCFDGDAAAKPSEVKLHSQFQEFDGFAASLCESLQLLDLFFQGTAFKDKQR